jgi:hypothetical protein
MVIIIVKLKCPWSSKTYHNNNKMFYSIRWNYVIKMEIEKHKMKFANPSCFIWLKKGESALSTPPPHPQIVVTSIIFL